MVQIGHGESPRLIRMSTLMVGTIPATRMESQQSTCTTFGRANLWREDQREKMDKKEFIKELAGATLLFAGFYILTVLVFCL